MNECSNGTRPRRRRRVTSSRADKERRRDDGGETDEQMRDGGVRVRSIDARDERTNDANAEMHLDWDRFSTRARETWERRGTTVMRARVGCECKD